MTPRDLLCLCVVLLAQGVTVAGFVAPLQPSRTTLSRFSLHSFQPLESTTKNNDNANKEEPTTALLVNFPNVTEESNNNNGGYSLNGYSGSSAYHNALKSRDPQPGLLGLSQNAAYNLEEFNEDGYGDMRRNGKKNKRSMVEGVVKFPFRTIRRIANGGKVVEPGALILVRHGESVWNANKTFTGELVDCCTVVLPYCAVLCSKKIRFLR